MADRFVLYLITRDEKSEGTFWKPCGVGFRNRDGSVNVRLDLFPGLDFQLREPKERDERDARDESRSKSRPESSRGAERWERGKGGR